MENTMKMYVTADEAAQILGVSRGYAYKIIRGLNNELKEKGYRVISGKAYAIRRTKEVLRQKQKLRNGSVISGNSREKIWILTLRILLKSISLMWRTGLEKAQSRIKDMCLI